MKTLSADIVFPVSEPPIRNGYLKIDDNGTILEIGQFPNQILTDHHFDGAICPGFVNAHCHLELSFMFEKIPVETGLIEFISQVIQIRDSFDEQTQQAAIQMAEQQMWSSGIVAVGDISNDTRSFEIKRKSNLRFHTFVEIFDFQPSGTLEAIKKGKEVFEYVPKSNGNTASITPHAPYSCTPTLVNFCDRFSSTNTPILSIHNQEQPQENQYFIDKTGSWKDLFEKWNINQKWLMPAGKTSLQAMGEFLTKRNKILLIHNTFTSAEDVKWASENLGEIYYCSCPNANRYIENQLPNYHELLDAGATICLGTDSLASNWQLSILEEMKTIQKNFKQFSTEQLLKWACYNGAKALNFHEQLGSFEIGKKPGVVLIDQLDSSFNLTEGSKSKRIDIETEFYTN